MNVVGHDDVGQDFPGRHSTYMKAHRIFFSLLQRMGLRGVEPEGQEEGIPWGKDVREPATIKEGGCHGMVGGRGARPTGSWGFVARPPPAAMPLPVHLVVGSHVEEDDLLLGHPEKDHNPDTVRQRDGVCALVTSFERMGPKPCRKRVSLQLEEEFEKFALELRVSLEELAGRGEEGVGPRQ
ncbi:MAG: hypothetical protein ACOYXN_10495 [Acidobacteriota bacterium]